MSSDPRNAGQDYQRPAILALASNKWDGPWMNRQQLLTRLGQRSLVLYSNGAWAARRDGTVEWSRAGWSGAFVQRDHVLLDYAPRWLRRLQRSPTLDRAVLRVAARRWRRELAKRSGDGPLIAYVFHPSLYPYVQFIRPDVLVYHAYDLFRLSSAWDDQLAGYQERLAAQADLVIGSSRVIVEELSPLAASRVRLLPNAVDYEAFVQGVEMPEPADLAAIPGPRVGYTGNINRKFDAELLSDLAARRPHWQFVCVGLVGNSDEAGDRALDRARSLPNVHFLGFKKYFELPAYVARMDVNIMCYRVADSWMRGGFPLKLFEYLATGRPVVGSDLPSVTQYAHVVRIARGFNDWDAALTEALERGGVGTPDSRRAVAKANTWDQRVDVLSGWLGDHVPSGPSEAAEKP